MSPAFLRAWYHRPATSAGGVESRSTICAAAKPGRV